MDTLLRHMLTLLFGTRVASCYSWHSLRIGLATALKAANVDDAVIQMICRWMNPESLRAYARHGQSLHINCVDAAEKAIIDTVQTANVPKVCNSEGAAAINLEFGKPISVRAQAVLDAADEAATHDAGAPPEAADLRPLQNECAGRRVLVPSAAWPRETCDENDGRGWDARIVDHKGDAATVRFLHACTPRGLPYDDVQLHLGILQPI